MPTRPPKYPLVRYLKVENAYTSQVKKVLEQAAKNVEADILRLGTGGNPLTRLQLEAQRAAITAQLRQTFEGDIKTIIANGQRAAAEDAVRVIGEYEKELLAALGGADYYDDIVRAEAARASAGINRLMSRYSSSYKPLSERVYRAGTIANGAIDKAVNVALVQGLSARDFAKSIKSLIDPSVAGGVSYAAMRTARTEINNANHAASQERYAASGIVEAVDWFLSTSHPEGDICDSLKADSPYKINEVPEKPHPQCLCFTTPALPDRKEFLDRLLRGDYGDEPWAGEARQVVAPRTDTLEVQRKKTWEAYVAKDAELRAQRLKFSGLDYLRDPEYKRLMGERDAAMAATTKVSNLIAKQARISAAANQPKIAALNSIGQPRPLSIAAMGANPKGVGWNGLRTAAIDYQINCTRVAAATEMRARGFSVSAAGTPQKVSDPSKRDSSIKQNWVDPKTGSPRALKSVATEEALIKGMMKEPEGARFFVIAPWKNGGAHIWNAEKVNGRIVFVEGQTDRGLSSDALTTKYLNNMKFGGKGEYGVRFMRVDDLLPTDSLVTRKWLIPE